jgi:hypothetical protein
VATDVTILQDGPKNVDILLPELSKKYVKILNSHAMSQMKAKGYGVSSEYISTGLNVLVGAQVFVSTNRAAKTGERITGAHMIKRRGSTPSKIQVALIDVNTGKIVWANEVIAQVGDPHFIQKQMTKLFEKMPPYGSVKTKS